MLSSSLSSGTCNRLVPILPSSLNTLTSGANRLLSLSPQYAGGTAVLYRSSSSTRGGKSRLEHIRSSPQQKVVYLEPPIHFCLVSSHKLKLNVIKETVDCTTKFYFTWQNPVSQVPLPSLTI